MRKMIPVAIAALVFVAPAQARLTRAERTAVNRTIDAFVPSAVRRVHVADSYDLVTPQERAGLTRAQWAKGDIPVYPYPARGTSWHGWTLDYALPNEVAFELVLAPRRPAKLDPIAFSVSLKKIRGRWLVDSFYPAATFIGSESRVLGPRDFAAARMASTAGDSALSTIWIVVPAAAGGLGFLGLIGLLAVIWFRGRSPKPSQEKQARDAEFWELLRSRPAEPS